MKKVFIFALSLSALAFTSSIFAGPSNIEINIQCPLPEDPTSGLGNFGDFIGGYGIENIQKQNKTIYFKSVKPISDQIPSDLKKYHNTNVNYDSVKGEVTCQYTGNGSDFTVMYTMQNGKGGFVINQTPAIIYLQLPVGFVK